MTDLTIRQCDATDLPALSSLYRDAFPDEELFPLVNELVLASFARSLIGIKVAKLVGHVTFTLGTVSSSDAKVALLGPLAVASEHQRQGIGTTLIREGLQAMKAEGVTRVFVLGNPAYYSRSGFATETRVRTPRPIPDAWRTAWQSLSLDDGESLQGDLLLPELWMQPELWAPPEAS